MWDDSEPFPFISCLCKAGRYDRVHKHNRCLDFHLKRLHGHREAYIKREIEREIGIGIG